MCERCEEIRRRAQARIAAAVALMRRKRRDRAIFRSRVDKEKRRGENPRP